MLGFTLRVRAAHLARKVGRVGQDCPLVGPSPDEVLQHVLLLGEVAVELWMQGGSIVSTVTVQSGDDDYYYWGFRACSSN